MAELNVGILQPAQTWLASNIASDSARWHSGTLRPSRRHNAKMTNWPFILLENEVLRHEITKSQSNAYLGIFDAIEAVVSQTFRSLLSTPNKSCWRNKRGIVPRCHELLCPSPSCQASISALRSQVAWRKWGMRHKMLICMTRNSISLLIYFSTLGQRVPSDDNIYRIANCQVHTPNISLSQDKVEGLRSTYFTKNVFSEINFDIQKGLT